MVLSKKRRENQLHWMLENHCIAFCFTLRHFPWLFFYFTIWVFFRSLSLPNVTVSIVSLLINHDIYTSKGGANTYPMLPLDGLSISYAVGKDNRGFKNIRVNGQFLKLWKSLSLEGKCEGTPDGFHWTVFPISIYWWTKTGVSKAPS